MLSRQIVPEFAGIQADDALSWLKKFSAVKTASAPTGPAQAEHCAGGPGGAQ
jgi:hypothetical protein